MLAGHILVQSGAVMGDMSGAHHFATIGRYSRVGARTPVRRDVPPYTDFYSDAYDWSPPAVRGIHDRGIAAAGLSRVEEADLRRALHELFDEESALATKIEQLVNMGAEGEVARLCDFCQQSLAGVYGRYRERFRGQVPPEAWPYLPPEKRQTLGGR
jgi:UDP-N-acetylglucosamine acyltransferase